MKRKHTIFAAGALVFLLSTVSMAVLAASSNAEAGGEVGGAQAVEQSVSTPWSAEDAEVFLALYGEFGMTFDAQAGNLQFEGKDIVFFLDEDSDGTLVNTFSLPDPEGGNAIGVMAERNENGTLTGLRELRDEALEEMEISVARASDVSEAGVETAFESDDEADEIPETEYAAFGVTTDGEGRVYYNGEPAGFFWDESHYHYFASYHDHGPLLLVDRNASGEITGVREITAKKAEAISGLCFSD